MVRFLARNARWVLVAGLIAGVALPSWAAVLTPWLRVMVAALLALTAFRIGPALLEGFRGALLHELRAVLILQLGLPLFLVGGAILVGLGGQALILSLGLMLAAPSIMSAPALCQMMGRTGARAMRLLVLGSALLPVTVVPVLWLMFGTARIGEVVAASLTLLVLIGGAVTAGVWARHMAGPLRAEGVDRVDAANAVLMAIFVIALMPAIAATWAESPSRLLLWLGAAFAANLGLQVLSWRLSGDVDLSVVAGNRNMSLFLAVLPADSMAPVLTFLGCYQIPMLLTPVLMRRLYQKERG